MAFTLFSDSSCAFLQTQSVVSMGGGPSVPWLGSVHLNVIEKESGGLIVEKGQKRI